MPKRVKPPFRCFEISQRNTTIVLQDGRAAIEWPADSLIKSALCGLLERAAHCIKRSGTIRLQPICPALTRPASLFLADEADHDDPLISVLAPPRSTLCRYAVTASKWVSSFQIRPNSAASLRATATRARFGPRRFSTLRPQLLSAEGLLTVVNSTFAAS
jgi:hypothetical protein